VNVDFSICEGDYQRPTIAQNVFPNTANWFVWSGSPDASHSNLAWGVDFRYGYDSDGRSGYGHVRLVRGGQ